MMQYHAASPDGGMSEVHDMDVIDQADGSVLNCRLFYDPTNRDDVGPVYAQLDVRCLGRLARIGIDLRKRDYAAQIQRQLRYWDLAGA